MDPKTPTLEEKNSTAPNGDELVEAYEWIRATLRIGKKRKDHQG